MKQTKAYIHAKNTVVNKIIKDIQKTGRAIVRGLGTFKVVTHKEKISNLGHIPERQIVRFTATRSLKELVNARKKLSTK